MKKTKLLLTVVFVSSIFINVKAHSTQSNYITVDASLATADAALHRSDNEAIYNINGFRYSTLKTKNIPNRIVASINGDPRYQRGFNWFTSLPFDDAEVKVSLEKDLKNAVSFKAQMNKVESYYMPRDEKGYFIYDVYDEQDNWITDFTSKNRSIGWSATQEGKKLGGETSITPQKIDEYSYKALAVNLKPNAQYYYQVGSETGGYSEVGTFKTSGSIGEEFSFLHYTDTQNLWSNEHMIDEAAYGASTLEEALKTAPNADFVVHTGDIVEIAQSEDEWVDLLEKSKKSLLNTTLVAASGNHDEYGFRSSNRFPYKFNEHLNVPVDNGIDGGSYYSYDYNGVHFVVLNTNDYKVNGKALSATQLEWIKNDVKQARENGAQWVILAYHKPLYSKGYHSLQDRDVQAVRDEFMKLIDELDIDLALQGHDHVVSRTKSLQYVPTEVSRFNAKVVETVKNKEGNSINPQGTTFVLPNTAGTKTYDSIYDKGLEHVHKVRTNLRWLTQELLDEYNNLFEIGFQPQQSERFTRSHSNGRDSMIQNFSKYTIKDDKLVGEMYQVEGELGSRIVKLVDSFVIEKKKGKVNIDVEVTFSGQPQETKAYLKVDGVLDTNKVLTFNVENEFKSQTFMNLPKYLEDGTEIKYEVVFNDLGHYREFQEIEYELGLKFKNHYLRNDLKVSYQFIGDQPLPKEVLVLLPVDSKLYEFNHTITPTIMFNPIIIGNQIWEFKGFEHKVLTTQDTRIEGKWTVSNIDKKQENSTVKMEINPSIYKISETNSEIKKDIKTSDELYWNWIMFGILMIGLFAIKNRKIST